MSAVLQKAVADFKAGRIPAAVQGVKKVLAGSPNLAEAHYLLGLFTWQGGDAAGGVPSLERACRLDPRRAGFQSARGAALVEAGRLEDGLRALEEATRLDPESQDAWKNLGMAAQKARRWEVAEPALERALRRRPEPGLSLRLAEVRLERGDVSGALPLLRELRRQLPAEARVHAALGIAHGAIADLEAALVAWEEALRLSPTRLDWRRAVARVRSQLWRLADCEADWRALLESAPGDREATVGLASALHRQGRNAEARVLLAPLRGEARDDPHYLEVLANVSATAELAPSVIVDLERHLAAAAQPSALLWNQLGKLLEREGRYDEAFSAHVRSNDLRGFSNDLERNQAVVDRLITLYPLGYADRLARAHVRPGPRPIFIVGMPRSGSSLTEQILDSHPLVYGGGERRDLHLLVSSLSPPFPEAGPAAKEAVLQQRADDLRRQWAALCGDRPVITDKMLSNFLFVGLIGQLFPDARVVWCVRDPLDNCLSIFFTYLLQQASVDSKLYGIGRYYRQHQRLMERWCAVSPIPVVRVNYEELVADLEGGTRRLLADLELPFDEACLRFHENERVVTTASYAQVKQPIYAQSVGRAERLYGGRLGSLRAGLAGAADPG